MIFAFGRKILKNYRQKRWWKTKRGVQQCQQQQQQQQCQHCRWVCHCGDWQFAWGCPSHKRPSSGYQSSSIFPKGMSNNERLSHCMLCYPFPRFYHNNNDRFCVSVYTNKNMIVSFIIHDRRNISCNIPHNRSWSSLFSCCFFATSVGKVSLNTQTSYVRSF